MVGEDADLPCHLSPKMSAETLQLMWERTGRRQVVHTYAHGQEDTPAEEYRGRTSISREDVTAGKAALRIRSISVSDNGTYLCYFQDGDFYAKAQVELQVAALGSDPHIGMKGYEAGGIRVNCTSAGWYPQPQIQWRDARGQSLSSAAASEAADPQGLYAASASVILEGAFFRDTQPWKVAFIVTLLLLLLVGLLFTVWYLLWRWRKRIRALFQEEGRAEAQKDAARAELWQAELRRQRSTQVRETPHVADPKVRQQDPSEVTDLAPAARTAALVALVRRGRLSGHLTPGLPPLGPRRPLCRAPWLRVNEGQACQEPSRVVSYRALLSPCLVPSARAAWAPRASPTLDLVASWDPHSAQHTPHLPPRDEAKASSVSFLFSATNRIYSKCGQEVPESSWRMFMRLAGLEENHLVICEHEDPGTLTEQHHRTLPRWQSELGRAVSPCGLVAVLREMRLRERLENVTSELVLK
ncbi:butyrophilin subfamily 3 member A2-like, partial [Phyllostomus hastatus]|uniref:butyrophilin subfamily 3 member A2-like n=1 Tax=Phyllostomus hastatus TaxID=9423 RepID=UPI001E68445F